MIKACERCFKEINTDNLELIHCCKDSDGNEYDYCEECWSNHTTDTEEITNLIIN